VSVDAWVLTMLDEEYYGYGAAMSYIGEKIGEFIAFILFI